MNRRLYRCRHDRRLAGVASGVAEYFEVDPSVVRVLWFLSIFLGGMGLFLYVAMALIVPLEPETGVAPEGVTPEGMTPTEHRHAYRGTGRATTWFGIILVLFGALSLVNALMPAWADGGRFLWPAFIVGIGVLLVAAGVHREPAAP